MYAVPLSVRAAPHSSHTLFSSSAIFLSTVRGSKAALKTGPFNYGCPARAGIRENKHENDTRPESITIAC